jgi:hypothetical protein
MLSIESRLSSRISGSFFHEYLAKPCLLPQIFFGETHARSFLICAVMKSFFEQIVNFLAL